MFGRALTDHAKRHRRKRRIIAGGVLLISVILAVVFGFQWRHSFQVARRAEANELLAVGAAHLDSDPGRNCSSTALAYVIASMESRDSPGAREFALQSVWSGSTGFAFEQGGSWISFAAGDEFLVSKNRDGRVEIFDRAGKILGQVPQKIVAEMAPQFAVMTSGRHDLIGLWDAVDGHLVLWSVSQMRVVRRLEIGPKTFPSFTESGMVYTFGSGEGDVLAKEWPPGADAPTVLGVQTQTNFTFPRGIPRFFTLGSIVGSFNRGDVWLHDVSRWNEQPVLLARHDADVLWGAFDRLGNVAATADESGVIKIWRFPSLEEAPLRELKGPRQIRSMSFDDEHSRFVAAGVTDRTSWLWNLDGPPTAQPWAFGGGEDRAVSRVMLSGDGSWLATSYASGDEGFLWPVNDNRPYVLATGIDFIGRAVFLPDGSWVVASKKDGSTVGWPLDPGLDPRSATLLDLPKGIASDLAVSPAGDHILAAGTGGVWLIPTEEGTPRRLKEPSRDISGAAFSADGRFAAVGRIKSQPDGGRWEVSVWDLETGEERTVGAAQAQTASSCRILFAPDGDTLYVSTGSRVYAVDLTDGSSRSIGRGAESMAISPDGRTIFLAGNIGTAPLGTSVDDFEDAGAPVLVSLSEATSVALNPSGETVVTGGIDGSIRVGRIGGGEPHVLLGHKQPPIVNISPGGRWIASTSTDGSLRLWPVPDLSKPPLHTLPREELIAKLKTLTNLRVVRDEEASSGWKLEVGPFPGWQTVPEW
jgi:WD40 repeat protein